jgi:hypothetical protein
VLDRNACLDQRKRRLSESLRQCFRQSGLPGTSVALGQSCSEMHSAQKQLVNVLREIAHPDVGAVARIRTANDSLLRSMTTRAQQMDDFLVRLEKQVLGIWLPVIAGAALALGFVLGTWFTSVPGVGSAPQIPAHCSSCQCRRLLSRKSFRNEAESAIESSVEKSKVSV